MCIKFVNIIFFTLHNTGCTAICYLINIYTPLCVCVCACELHPLDTFVLLCTEIRRLSSIVIILSVLNARGLIKTNRQQSTGQRGRERGIVKEKEAERQKQTLAYCNNLAKGLEKGSIKQTSS